MSKFLKRLLYALLAIIGVVVIGMYGFVAMNGYPTWEAMRNFLVKDGEIVVTLPEGVKVVKAKCINPETKVVLEGQQVITKIGHSWCTIEIDVEINGKNETLKFSPQKLNNWNRIHYKPKDPSDPQTDYHKIENGVVKPTHDFKRFLR